MTEDERKRRHYEARKRWAARNPEKLAASKRRYNQSEKGKTKNAASAKIWRAVNRERDRANRHAWCAANPEKVKASALRSRLKKVRTAVDKNRELRWHYGISIADYEALRMAQGSRCAICGTDKPGGRGKQLHVDHCHETGLIRGLLCNKCNSAIGYFADSPKRLRRAAAYLESWRGKTSSDGGRWLQPILGCISSEGQSTGGAEGVESIAS